MKWCLVFFFICLTGPLVIGRKVTKACQEGQGSDPEQVDIGEGSELMIDGFCTDDERTDYSYDRNELQAACKKHCTDTCKANKGTCGGSEFKPTGNTGFCYCSWE